LNDVSCWRVEQRGDRLFVTGKLSDRPRKQHGGSEGPASVVVIGAGAGGECTAETLREAGYAGAVTLVDPDPDAPYDRPNCSKDYLAGTASEDWIPLHPPEFYRDLEINIVRSRVVSIEPGARRVRLDDGRGLEYGALVLATGATPVRLPIEFEQSKPRVHYLRSFADSKAIIAAAAGARSAVVLGTSFIGLEVAASLRGRGLEVHVVGPDARPLERVLGPELGDLIRRLHEEHGVVFHLQQTAAGIRDGVVTLKNGKRLAADLVVAGIGVRPNTELAQAAGLAIDRGVLVDQWLETSAPGVFAVGDIARWPDPRSAAPIRVEHWVVAQRQGQAVARSILGDKTPFDAVPFFWSQHYDVPINYVGHVERWDSIVVDGDIDARDCAVRYQLHGRTAAVATIHRDRESLQAEVAMEEIRGSPLVSA
jgi:NADPH-dependent 2,4-dienoyl-CoA reductase/sulfur reductase-like enzyme